MSKKQLNDVFIDYFSKHVFLGNISIYVVSN